MRSAAPHTTSTGTHTELSWPSSEGSALAARRPGYRFGLIDAALAPAAGRLDPAGLTQLRRDLAVVVSADALFTLTDLCDLSRPDAVDSAVHTARALTEAAFREAEHARPPERAVS